MEGSHLLATPSLFADYLLPALPHSHLETQLGFQVRRRGTLHGFAIWFDLRFTEGIHLTTGPNKTPLAWHQMFLPLEQPIPLNVGARIDLKLAARSGPDHEIWWDWEGHCWPKEKNGHTYDFRHNSFRSIPLPPKGVDRNSQFTSRTQQVSNQELEQELLPVEKHGTVEPSARHLSSYSQPTKNPHVRKYSI